jgi:hypothetical protein
VKMLSAVTASPSTAFSFHNNASIVVVAFVHHIPFI